MLPDLKQEELRVSVLDQLLFHLDLFEASAFGESEEVLGHEQQVPFVEGAHQLGNQVLLGVVVLLEQVDVGLVLHQDVQAGQIHFFQVGVRDLAVVEMTRNELHQFQCESGLWLSFVHICELIFVSDLLDLRFVERHIAPFEGSEYFEGDFHEAFRQDVDDIRVFMVDMVDDFDEPQCEFVDLHSVRGHFEDYLVLRQHFSSGSHFVNVVEADLSFASVV